MRLFANIAKPQLCCLFCAVLAFAQQPSEEKSFDKLRGFAYNPYGTLGAAPAIADILQKPSDIYGHKFVYINPVSNSGYSAFDLAGGSALLGFNQSLVLGFAKSFYGLSLGVYPNRRCLNNDGYECTGEYNIGLNFSMPLGNLILYAHADNTIKDTNDSEYNENVEYIRDSKQNHKRAYIGITGGNTLVWDFNLDLYRRNLRVKSISYEESSIVEIESTHTTPSIQFNIGYKILQNDRLKFTVGLNNYFFWMYTKSEANYSYFYTLEEYSFPDNRHDVHINVYPNFLGEVVLTKHLLAFVGARYGIFYEMFLYEDYYSDIIVGTYQIGNYGSSAYLGLRYERERWAVETRLQSDAFGEILSGDSPFIGLGAFIWL